MRGVRNCRSIGVFSRALPVTEKRPTSLEISDVVELGLEHLMKAVNLALG